jgi:hypothetical protein
MFARHKGREVKIWNLGSHLGWVFRCVEAADGANATHAFDTRLPKGVFSKTIGCYDT